jgi:predicted RNase H-like nuclease (RuvC/YqgF family)
VSKSLKQLAYDTIEAHQETIADLRTQLAKANERVKELERINLELAVNVESCCELVDMDMGAAIERLFEIDNTESKALLKEFAIEQKQAAINSIKDKWIKKASDMPLGLECRSKGSSCYNWAMYYAKELTDEAEQLRKE